MSQAEEAPRSRKGARGGLAVHQLRAPPADFVGRREELADLRARLGPGGAIIAGLTGQGGVGKTALALVVAHELRERYPDAQIDIDLKGTSAAPLAPEQVMAEVIRAFEPEAKLPESMDALGRVYRSTLDGRRALLLFDNARDRAQVEPLIPPRECLMLVTSRQHFTLPGIHTRRLGLLDADQAVRLVRDVARRLDEVTASELARLCGYLPLALRVAARTLAERITIKPDSYIEQLRSAQDRLDEVDAVLSESLVLLDAPTRELWLRLGVFHNDFDREAASAVSGVGDTVDRLLGELVRWSLLEWQEQTERYRLHDLACDYARSRLQAEERQLAERRHADHFLTAATDANDLFKNGASTLGALARLDLEWGNITAMQTWSAAHAANDDTAARVCCALPVQAADVLALRQHPRERIRWVEAGIGAAQRLVHRGHEGKLLCILGNAVAALGDERRAIEYYEQSLMIARETGDRSAEGTVLGNLGIALSNLGDPHQAIENIEQHLAITRELGDRRGEGRALGNLGTACAAASDPDRAIEYFEQNLAVARQIGNRHGEATALGNLGAACLSRGEVSRSIVLCEQHLTITREIGDRSGEVRALGNLGLAYADIEDTHQAIEYYERALSIAREIGEGRNEALISWNLGVAYAKLGELPRAVELMQARVDFERALEHPDADKHEADVDRIRALLPTQHGVW